MPPFKSLALAMVAALAVTGLIGTAEARPGATVQIVRVSTPTAEAKRQLAALGLDLTENAGPGFIDVVLHGEPDAATLRRAGLRWQVRVPDVALADRQARSAERQYAANTAISPLPSGRTSYRTLSDYEAELRTLARRNAKLVRLFTLPHRTLEGRRVYGIEIGRAREGRPVFLMMGLHHAREWPSGELTMEFGYDLIKNYGSDPRITRLLDAAQVILVPVVNPDGFDKSRGGGGQEAKRKNCRVADGRTAPPPVCSVEENWQLGVDNNRNYGLGWGGTGASTIKTAGDYRGISPFSEPETRNIRELVSNRQVTTLITNHTYARMVLRPPFTQAEGDAPDEPAFKALSEAMTAQNGYQGLKSADDYETTGETPDWSYYATRGLGYTIEIGDEADHPPFPKVIDEYLGVGPTAGKGNRGAYLVALDNAIDRKAHGLISGRTRAGRVLTISKRFTLWTSPVANPDGSSGRPLPIATRLRSQLVVPASGRFDWDVNPSVRPMSPFTETGPRPATGFIQESWTLTCATPRGRVLETITVKVDRGQRVVVNLRRCAR